MAKVKIKVGTKIDAKTGISDELIEKKMNEFISLHKCGSCDAKNCNGKPNIENECVTRGIEVKSNKGVQKRVVFDCLYYRKKPDTTTAENERKYFCTFSVSPVNEVLSSIDYSDYDFGDDYSDEFYTFMEQYGNLLDDFEEPVFTGSRMHR